MTVPEGWTQSFPSEIVSLFSGFAFKSSDSTEIGTRWLKIANVGVGEVKWDDAAYLPPSYEEKYKKFFLTEGDVVVAMTRPTLANHLKIARLVQKTDRALLNQRVAKLIAINGNDLDFAYQLFRSERVAFEINTALRGTDPPNLSISILRDFKVLVPPPPEQKKIAQILSTWDKAIAITEKLLANSQQQKKALMQQLLTGKKRLCGFGDKWSDSYLVDVAQVIVSNVDKKTVEGEIPVSLCNYTDVYYNSQITKKLNFMKATASPSEIERFSLREGDVIITKDSETPGDIAVPALVAQDLGGVVCGYHLAILRPRRGVLDGAFLSHLLSAPQMRYYFFTLATGATRFGLSLQGIKKSHFKLPSYKEQLNIAAVLSATDREIETLTEVLDILASEKRALMQQLLTGRRRVNTQSTVAA